MTKEQAIADLLRSMEADQRVYEEYLKDRTRRKEDLQVVHMKSFFDLLAFNKLKSLLPEYTPGEFVGKRLAQELGTAGNYVTIVDNQVVISPAYNEFLATKAEFLKHKN